MGYNDYYNEHLKNFDLLNTKNEIKVFGKEYNIKKHIKFYKKIKSKIDKLIKEFERDIDKNLFIDDIIEMYKTYILPEFINYAQKFTTKGHNVKIHLGSTPVEMGINGDVEEIQGWYKNYVAYIGMKFGILGAKFYNLDKLFTWSLCYAASKNKHAFEHMRLNKFKIYVFEKYSMTYILLGQYKDHYEKQINYNVKIA